jgi:cytochrome P450
LVIMCAFITHRDPRNFDNPLGFDPGRWESGVPPTAGRITYFPFGAGPHRCVGEGLGTALGTLILAVMLRAWRFEVVEGEEPTMNVVAFQPPGRVPVRVRGRGV